MSQDNEYPPPNYINPLKGITDTNMLKYWLQHGLLDTKLQYSKQDTHGRVRLCLLEQHAETVDILFLTYNLDYYVGEYTPQLCTTLTWDSMMQLYQLSRNKSHFKLASFHYTLPNGDKYYSIVEILKNIKEDEIDMYMDKYSKQYPPIFVLLSTLPYERSRQLLDSIRSIKRAYFTLRLYEDYLICSTAFNTFHPDIYCIFKGNDSAFFDPAATYSPSAMQYMVNDDPRFKVEDWDAEMSRLRPDTSFLFSPQCLDMILASNKCRNISYLLKYYIQLDDINKVKLLLEGNTSLGPGSITDDITLLRYAESTEMVHLLVSYKAPVSDSFPLRKATARGSIDLVKALLYHKASLEIDQRGFHPLRYFGSTSLDVLQFFIPFFLSSTSDIAIQVKTNNTTGLPDDVYNYIKTSLSKMDINTCVEYSALLDVLSYGIHAPYLLENNASPHLYIQNKKNDWKVIAYDDVISMLDNNSTSLEPYHHYIDNTLLHNNQPRVVAYHNIYNLMKYKAYPSTYISDNVNSNGNNTLTKRFVYYSYLSRSIMNRHRDFISLLLRYLSPVNMSFKSYRNDPISTMYPIETALRGDSPNKDIVYELIQYGAIYPNTNDNNIDKHLKGKYNHLHCTIKNLLIDQCFPINDEYS